MKRKKIALKDIQLEAISVLDFVLAEAYARGKDVHYRLTVPYGPVKAEDGISNEVDMIVDFSVYFDGELTDERNESKQVTKFKISGPKKSNH